MHMYVYVHVVQSYVLISPLGTFSCQTTWRGQIIILEWMMMIIIFTRILICVCSGALCPAWVRGCPISFFGVSHCFTKIEPEKKRHHIDWPINQSPMQARVNLNWVDEPLPDWPEQKINGFIWSWTCSRLAPMLLAKSLAIPENHHKIH